MPINSRDCSEHECLRAFSLESAVDQGSIYFVSFVVVAFVVFGMTIAWASIIAPGAKHDNKK